jgi:Sulfotransferase domain
MLGVSGSRGIAAVRHRLPDFIGVGPPRTATTWLHQALTGHVGLPRGVKESNFFRWQYSHGLEWYASLFRDCPVHAPIGEFSPNYFAAREARERIHTHIADCKIICTLRDPVERLYSNYRKMYEQTYFVGSFEESLARRPELLEWSKYAVHVSAWQRLFGRENVLVLLQEDLKYDPQKLITTVCAFIGIPEIVLDSTMLGAKEVNAVPNAPRSLRLAKLARSARDRLERRGSYKAISLFRQSWVRKVLFASGAPFPRIASATEWLLRTEFRADIDALEGILQRDLSMWKVRRTG